MSTRGRHTRISEDDKETPQTAMRKSLRVSPRRKQIEEDWAQVMAAKPPSKPATDAARAPAATASSGSPTEYRERSASTGSSYAATPSKPTASNQYDNFSGKRSPATSPTKKRPYRRTKRPKNYNDKSTVTTTTRAAETPVNVYDAVLGEAEDLLRAASEAQDLGRLKMSGNFLLLLHARLVGLGKKFDLSKRTQETEASSQSTRVARGGEELKPTKLDMNISPDGKSNDSFSDDGDKKPHATPRKDTPQKQDQEEKKCDAEQDKMTPSRATVPPSNGISEAALNQLTNYLPSDIEMDSVMIEHLARAAVELQLKRSGRKTTHDGLLNSPAVNTEEVLHYNKDVSPKKGGLKAQAPVAWTQEEHAKFQKAVNKVGSSDPAKIAKLMGSRNETQVKAYLRNASEIEKGAVAMEHEILEDTPRKRGGRGRKPPTTAMNTVPNANLDARSMLQGLGKKGL